MSNAFELRATIDHPSPATAELTIQVPSTIANIVRFLSNRSLDGPCLRGGYVLYAPPYKKKILELNVADGRSVAIMRHPFPRPYAPRVVLVDIIGASLVLDTKEI